MSNTALSTCRHLRIAACLFAVTFGVSASLPAELWGPRSRFIQDGPGGELQGSIAAFDGLGRALAVGDFDGDRRDDLAIAENESESGAYQGIVHVLFGAARGFRPADGILADFDPASGLANNEPGDEFGAALVAGNFNGDDFGDLAIGIPGEDIAAVVAGGSGLDPARSIFWAEGYRGSAGGNQGLATDRSYGFAVAAGDFDGDRTADLAVGAINVRATTGSGDVVPAGAVYVLFGALFADGFETADAGLWSLATP
jgi:hypothetical protein